MDRTTVKALEYFRPAPHAFWRGAEGGTVIEWQTGKTICYRDELEVVLRNLAPQGWPPMGTLLLMIAACQDSWKDSEIEQQFLMGLGRTLWEKSGEGERMLETTEDFVHYATEFMDIIRALPGGWRRGAKRIHLLIEVAARMPERIPEAQAREMLAEYSSGRLDELTLTRIADSTLKAFTADLENLHKGLSLFQNAEQLELVLRTGLDYLPAPIDVELPDAEPADLLSQLAERDETAGLARLTRRLMAALHIPMRTRGASDLPFGGVSDITNRGDFDRLLISELAHEDWSLMARLVNNEALYLRREEPPAQEIQRTRLLIDTTIKMWGLPRVFALAAALACAQSRGEDRSVEAHAFSGRYVTPVDLSRREGVIQALERVDGALHGGEALQTFFMDQPVEEQTETILITEHSLLSLPAFQNALRDINLHLDFLVTVDRSGNLHLYRVRAGRRSLLRKTQHDLRQALSSEKIRSHPSDGWGEVPYPAFLQQERSPLLFPTFGMEFYKSRLFQSERYGVFGVSRRQQLLFWSQKKAGGRQLMDFMEPARYTFGFHGEHNLFIFAPSRQKKIARLYQVEVNTGRVQQLDLAGEIRDIERVAYVWPYFEIQTEKERILLDIMGKQISSRERRLYYVPASVPPPKRYGFSAKYQTYRKIYPGYSVFLKGRSFGVNGKRWLTVGNWTIAFAGEMERESPHLRLYESRGERDLEKVVEVETKSYLHPRNRFVKLRRAVWPDETEAFIDNRGLLHLRSSDPDLPEVSLLLLIDSPLTCWASDGVLGGDDRFCPGTNSDAMDGKSFYEKYIWPIVKRIG